MKTILYCRVSTADQTLAHQQNQAEGAGFQIDEVVADHGVSGISTRLRERPEGRRLFDILRAGDVLLVRWLDRLGRNYTDVTDTIREYMRRGVIIKTVINGMVFDGRPRTPCNRQFATRSLRFMAASAQAQAEATKEAQRAGIAYALANDDGTKFRGRKADIYRRDICAGSTPVEPRVRHCRYRAGNRTEAADHLSDQTAARTTGCGLGCLVS